MKNITNNNAQSNPAADPLKYDRQQTFTLDREFVLTQDKKLVIGLPYLYSEGNRSVAVRLLKVWLDYELQDEFVYLSLQELQTERIFIVSWNLNYSGSYFLWSLADLPSIMNGI